LEDDFQLCENFDIELERCLSELPENWNALWLGGVVVKGKEDYSDNLLKIGGTTGTYGYIVKHSFISKILEALAKENKLADWAMSSVFENVFRSKKNLVKHRAGYSIIKGKDVNYTQ
jgi:GR25 family glycosyltransferase involved in LPS biosynthesis